MKRRCGHRSCVLVGLLGVLSFSPQTRATLHVIADVGGESTAPFYDGLRRQDDRSVMRSPGGSAAPGETDMLPVVTPELTPGAVTARPLQLPGLGALFLIGDDPLSGDWLSRNATALARHRAVGMIVNVASTDALQALRDRAPGILMVPAAGSELARRLRLSHYPVLITETGLYQEGVP